MKSTDPITRLLEAQREKRDPYAMGFDCGENGANTENCHFAIFGSKESTRQWEKGKRDAEARKANSVPSA